jgi:hypothetical protein
MTKVLNHRLEKLSSLLNAKETQLNVENINVITIVENEASDENACSSTIKVEPLLIQQSKISKIKATIRKDTFYKRFTTSTQLSIHNRIHSKHKRFACDQKIFSTKDNLSTHKGERPYSCDLCPKKIPTIRWSNKA